MSTNPQRQVTFRHPAFPTSTNRLMALPALDHPDGGIHHGTAHTACAIITGNRFDGYFSTSPDGPPVASSPDSILTGSDYFFCVPRLNDRNASQPYNYPVVVHFSEWPFPHGNVPLSWLACCAPKVDYGPSDFSDPSYLRDGSCRISGSTEDCKLAHVCLPSLYSEWFPANDMDRYSFDNDPYRHHNTEDPANLLHLRADLRKSFQKRNFVFVPKGGRMVVQLLTADDELASQYHNVPLSAPHGAAPQYLLARFAHCILPLLSDFLRMGVPRRIVEFTSYRPTFHDASPEELTRGLAGYQHLESLLTDNDAEEDDDGDGWGGEGDR